MLTAFLATAGLVTLVAIAIGVGTRSEPVASSAYPKRHLVDDAAVDGTSIVNDSNHHHCASGVDHCPAEHLHAGGRLRPPSRRRSHSSQPSMEAAAAFSSRRTSWRPTPTSCGRSGRLGSCSWGRPPPGRVVGIDPLADLAFVQVSRELGRRRPFGTTDDLATAPTSSSSGIPRRRTWCRTLRLMPASLSRPVPWEFSGASWVHSGSAAVGGQSGGALVDNYGRLVGVHDVREPIGSVLAER